MARILVAEDDPAMLSILAETLVLDGFDVECVDDGGRLLVEIVRARPASRAIDLVVADIRMPTCTGLQILEAVRATHRELPVILMTAFGDDETRERVEELGAILFDKPFDPKELSAAVIRMLGESVPR
jgi:DNA-binding response OmpR family regulator